MSLQRILDGGALPESMGMTADLYAQARQLRLAMEKEIEPVREVESRLKEHLINNLSKGDDTGAAGKKYRAQVVTKTVPKIADWVRFINWVKMNGRWDMLQKRLSDKAVKDAWEEGVDVHGIERFHAVDVSITKI